MTENILNLIPTKSDKELAQDLRKELTDNAQSFMNAVEKAYSHGFNVNFQFGVDAQGKCYIIHMTLSKLF